MCNGTQFTFEKISNPGPLDQKFQSDFCTCTAISVGIQLLRNEQRLWSGEPGRVWRWWGGVGWVREGVLLMRAGIEIFGDLL